MNHDDDPRFREAFAILGELAKFYPNANLVPGTWDAYAEKLQDIDANLLRAAIARVVQTSKFFPTVAEIREAANALIPDSHLDAEAVWGEIRAQISAVGYTGTPTFSDPLILTAVEWAMGSWDAICAAPLDERMSNRSRIIDAYRVLVKRAREAEEMSPAIRELVQKAIAAREKVSPRPAAAMPQRLGAILSPAIGGLPPELLPSRLASAEGRTATAAPAEKLRELEHLEAIGAITEVQREARSYELAHGLRWTLEQRARIETRLSVLRHARDAGEMSEPDYERAKREVFGA